MSYTKQEDKRQNRLRHDIEDKLLAISAYGGKCLWCDEKRVDRLTLDHIHGGGTLARKEGKIGRGHNIYRQLRLSNYPPEYQVLCHNDNWRAYLRTREQSQNKDTRYYHRLRMIAFDTYGGAVCAECGENDINVLTIDHINGGGRQHRLRDSGNNIYRLLKREGYPPGYRVLCRNCNCARQTEIPNPEWTPPKNIGGRSKSKLHASQIAEIAKRARGGETHRSLAIEFGISATHVNNIKHGERWSNIIDQTDVTVRRRQKLSPKEILDIYTRAWRGESHQTISNDYPVTRNTVSAIKHGYMGKKITDHLRRPSKVI